MALSIAEIESKTSETNDRARKARWQAWAVFAGNILTVVVLLFTIFGYRTTMGSINNSIKEVSQDVDNLDQKLATLYDDAVKDSVDKISAAFLKQQEMQASLHEQNMNMAYEMLQKESQALQSVLSEIELAQKNSQQSFDSIRQTLRLLANN